MSKDDTPSSRGDKGRLGGDSEEASEPSVVKSLPPNEPFKCEFGHVQVNKCKQGHPVYAHEARWCCACDADIAFALSWIEREPEFQERVNDLVSKRLAEATDVSNPQSSPSATTKSLEEILKNLMGYGGIDARTPLGKKAKAEALAAINNLINQRVIEELEKIAEQFCEEDMDSWYADHVLDRLESLKGGIDE